MDDILRRAERQAAYDPEAEVRLLRQQIRAGHKLSLPLFRGVGHHKVNWPDAPILDVLKLKAYLGDPVAREIADYADACLLCNKPIGFMHLPEHCTTIGTWAAEIPDLAAPLPPVRMQVKCNCLWIHRSGDTHISTKCPYCKGRGYCITPVPASRYISVRVGLAVGRAAYQEKWKAWGLLPSVEMDQEAIALEAIEKWCGCPCRERAEVCNNFCALDGLPDWAVCPMEIAAFGAPELEGLEIADPRRLLPSALTSAAEIIDVQAAALEVFKRT